MEYAELSFPQIGESTSTYASDPLITGFFIVYLVALCIAAIVVIFAYWKLFKKAGQPGWAAIIPIYNIYILLLTVKRPGWWIFLLLIPIVNIIIMLLVALDLARVFGKTGAFGLFLNFLLTPIGPLIIGFGDSKYISSSK